MYVTLGLIRAMDVATGILTARLLGPHDRGLYSLLVMIPHTLENVLKLGIAPANIYMICRSRVPAGHVVSNSVLLALGLGAVALLVLPFRDVLGEKLLGDVDGWYLTLAVALVPLYLLTTYMTSILYALDRFKVANLRTTLSAALRLAGTALVLVVLGKGLFEAFLVNVALGALAGVWLLPVVWRITAASVRPHLAVAAATVRFGLKSHAQTLLTALHLRLDHFLVALYLGPSEVAFYAIATHVAELLSGVHRPVSVVLYPRLAAASEARMHDTTITVCRHVLVLEALAAVAILLGARLAIVTLYGAAYLPAVPPLFILLPGVLMLSLFNLLARNFMSRDKQQITIGAGVVGLAANVGLNLALIPRLGIQGAALASTLSYSLATVILLVAFRRHSGAGLRGLVTIRRSDLQFYRKLLARVTARPLTA
jgi:O-antigen/teichoic acid export membrane protein